MHYISNAKAFIAGSLDCRSRSNYTLACLQLNQATIQALSAVMFPFLNYKPKTNNLNLLMHIAGTVLPEINELFMQQTERDQLLFRILRKAYNAGHLINQTAVTTEDTQELTHRCRQLIKLIRDKYDRFFIPGQAAT
jgi:HEPN domain-containing protein